MKFLIVSISDSHCHNGPAFTEIAKITNKSTKEYCDLHGYDCLFLDKNPDDSRPISWGRTFLLKEYLKNYSWVWLIDSDLMIMNHTIKLEHLIDERYDVVVAANEGKIDRINTGSILWKNSEASYHLIDMMYSDGEFANVGYWEQSTLIKLLKANPTLLDKPLSDRVKIVGATWLNSHFHYWFGEENFQHGQFCVHLAGSDNDYRLDTLNALTPYIIKPIKNIQERVQIWKR